MTLLFGPNLPTIWPITGPVAVSSIEGLFHEIQVQCEGDGPDKVPAANHVNGFWLVGLCPENRWLSPWRSHLLLLTFICTCCTLVISLTCYKVEQKCMVKQSIMVKWENVLRYTWANKIFHLILQAFYKCWLWVIKNYWSETGHEDYIKWGSVWILGRRIITLWSCVKQPRRNDWRKATVALCIFLSLLLYPISGFLKSLDHFYAINIWANMVIFYILPFSTLSAVAELL